VDYGILLLGVAALVGAGLLGSSAGDRKLVRLGRQLADVERKLDAVLAHLEINLPEPELDDVRALLRAGKKIQAIKAYRELTGADLKEAKDAVERMT
jgi:ribosomal protein L7/L12